MKIKEKYDESEKLRLSLEDEMKSLEIRKVQHDVGWEILCKIHERVISRLKEPINEEKIINERAINDKYMEAFIDIKKLIDNNKEQEVYSILQAMKKAAQRHFIDNDVSLSCKDKMEEAFTDIWFT